MENKRHGGGATNERGGMDLFQWYLWAGQQARLRGIRLDRRMQFPNSRKKAQNDNLQNFRTRDRLMLSTNPTRTNFRG